MADPANVVILRWRARVQSPRYWLEGGFRSPFGSCYMRSDQLVGLISPHLGGGVTIRTGEVGSGLMSAWGAKLAAKKASIIILTKHAAERMSPDMISDLRRSGALVGADHVDSDFSKLDGKPFDFHISATEAGRRSIAERFGSAPVFRIDHHADPRIRAALPSSPVLSAAYLGKPVNCRLPPSLMPDVSMLKAVTNPQMERALRTLQSFNFHYAVRPDETGQHIFKPFTKGFNAAAAAVNILVSQDADDAEFFLGSDYPYLVRGHDDLAICDVFARAKDGFNGPEWRRGLEAMRALREAVSPAAISKQFLDMVRVLSS